METLKFSNANGKLKKMAKEMNLVIAHVKSFDLPAGHTCPMANICKSWVGRDDNVTYHGKNMIFECYAVKAERQYESVKALRWHNFDLLNGCSNVEGMVELIENSLPNRVEIVRIHSSGDFFSKIYFTAWQQVAIRNPHIQFYAYTKVLQYVTDKNNSDNFHLIYSMGGKLDKAYTNEPACHVVPTVNEAYTKGLHVACQTIEDDYTMIVQKKSFAIVEH